MVICYRGRLDDANSKPLGSALTFPTLKEGGDGLPYAICYEVWIDHYPSTGVIINGRLKALVESSTDYAAAWTPQKVSSQEWY
ncbi:hypothetical protein N7541_008906 [Penicillium brevicompactum]|uniref:Uncharacterized protein n=1 Tax=Penicillium brevicompactum TaxID=5074 RepID=A0A9W9QX03_PENBR|nr:hypothetical protein N7541_008906 [Penicillium brevicompactum]